MNMIEYSKDGGPCKKKHGLNSVSFPSSHRASPGQGGRRWRRASYGTDDWPPGYCDRVKRICAIRTSLCTLSIFDPSSGHLTFITPIHWTVVAPFHIKHPLVPSEYYFFQKSLSLTVKKNLQCYNFNNTRFLMELHLLKSDKRANRLSIGKIVPFIFHKTKL